MSQTVADFVLERLRQWGVEQVFAYPGDGINGIVAAFGDAANRLEFIQARHEEMAALQAVGYAKFSGRVGVCLATSGPGAIHMLNGLYDAKLDHVPVVAIVGQTARTAMGGSYQQEIDLQTLFKDVACEYLVEVNVPQQLPNALDRAIRTAESKRAPTAVIIPADVQDQDYEPPRHAYKHVPSSPPNHPATAMLPANDQLVEAARLINGGSKVAILIGQGARGAAGEVMQLAEITGAGVAKALLGKDILPDTLPYVTGPIGFLGSRPSYALMQDCDTLIIIGSSLPYSQFLPDFSQARAVQIDNDARFIGLRYPTEVNLLGDAKPTLQALLPLLEEKADRSWREQVEKNVSGWWEVLERRALVEADPVNPMRIVWELSSRIPEDSIVTSDSGSAANWYATHLKMHDSMRASLSGTLATMGCAVPYAIGAKFAHPERPVVALVGDGAMQMNGLAELITIARYYKRWADPRCVVCVFHNNDLNQVTWELRAMGGAPKFVESQEIPDMSYSAFATQLGLEGIDVDSPDMLGDAWNNALRADRPTVLDVRCDPNIPPIPPHATFDQLASVTEALMRGDPDAWDVLVKGVRTKAQELG